MSSLTRQQLADYFDDGYLFPVDIMSDGGAGGLRDELESIELRFRDRGLLNRYWALNAHIVFPFAYRVVSHPAVLDAVSSVLGDDLLVWGCEIYIKEPKSAGYFSWHQDLTYWGLGSIDDEVTAWLALTEVYPENGGMQFVSGSHKGQLLDHVNTFAEDNFLFRGQEVAVEIDEADITNQSLRPGQMSLHHGRMFHRSRPNQSDSRRVGITARFVTPDVVPELLGFDYAMLVSGENRSDHFRLVPPPESTLGGTERGWFEKVVEHQTSLYDQGAEDQKPKWDRLT